MNCPYKNCPYSMNCPYLQHELPLQRLSRNALGIFLVVVPGKGVVGDVFTDAVQFSFVADDPFVVIALPDRNSGCFA